MNGSGGNGQPGSSFYSYSIRGNPKLSTATTSSGPRGQTRPTDTVRAACHGSAGDPVLTAAGEGSPGPLLGRGGRRWGLGLAAEKPAQKHNPQGPQAAGTSQLRGLPPGVGAWEGRRLAVAVEKSGTGALVRPGLAQSRQFSATSSAGHGCHISGRLQPTRLLAHASQDRLAPRSSSGAGPG